MPNSHVATGYVAASHVATSYVAETTPNFDIWRSKWLR